MWTLELLKRLYETPFFHLLDRASRCHRENHDPQEIQLCALLSVKTGGCPEDCSYCPQSMHYDTGVRPTPLTPLVEVIDWAREGVRRGCSRICLGAAWREVREGHQFDQVVEMVKAIAAMGVEVCTTLGMLNERQILRLKEAGLFAYNHNLDSSERFYSTIITTRSYQDRLQTLSRVTQGGVSLCSGAILGMGESLEDRLNWLLTLKGLQKEPDSIPINQLVAIAGTPLEGRERPSPFEVVRMVAVSRILFPKAKVRLSAGRLEMSQEAQALCFLAGANSIFVGEKLLTSPNPSFDEDEELLGLLDMKKSVRMGCG